MVCFVYINFKASGPFVDPEAMQQSSEMLERNAEVRLIIIQ